MILSKKLRRATLVAVGTVVIVAFVLLAPQHSQSEVFSRTDPGGSSQPQTVAASAVFFSGDHVGQVDIKTIALRQQQIVTLRQEQLDAYLTAVHTQQVLAAQQEAARQAQAAAQRAYTAANSPAAPRVVNSSPSSVGTPSAGPHACGGSLPSCCVMMRESGGSSTAVNGSSGASGKWQFMSGTWNGYGGYSSAAQAPESVQDQRAAQVYANGAGASNWAGPGC